MSRTDGGNDPEARRRFWSVPLSLLLLAAAPASDQRLEARFIGNAAFEIRGGDTTLLTDFPYRSAAFGYMGYDPSEIRRRTPSICLFTHGHADHFDASLIEKIGCRVVGPAQILSRVPAGQVVPLTAVINLSGLAITPVKTEHSRVEHFSYLVEWKGRRLYFTGDTESTEELGRQGPLDALFITPWLLESARTAKSLPEAGQVIVYHHKADERIPACPNCVIPRQGQVIEISKRAGPR